MKEAFIPLKPRDHVLMAVPSCSASLPAALGSWVSSTRWSRDTQMGAPSGQYLLGEDLIPPKGESCCGGASCGLLHFWEHAP